MFVVFLLHLHGLCISLLRRNEQSRFNFTPVKHSGSHPALYHSIRVDEDRNSGTLSFRAILCYYYLKLQFTNRIML